MSYPLKLSWSEAEISTRGACTEAMSEAVLVHLPILESKEARHPLLRESDPEYVKNDPIVLRRFNLSEILPQDGSTGYAFEMASLHESLNYEEAYQHVRAFEMSERSRIGAVLGEAQLDELVRIDLAVLGISRGVAPSRGEVRAYGLEVKNGAIYKEVHRFLRWVDETEFNNKAREAEALKAKAPAGTEPAWTFNRWYFALPDELRERSCIKCPLSLETLRMPGRNFWMETRACYIEFMQDDVEALFGHLAGISHFEILSTARELGEALSPEECIKLKNELKLARNILAVTKVHALVVYDQSGGKLHTEFPIGTVRENFPGYRISIKQGDSFISVMFRTKREGLVSVDTDSEPVDEMSGIKVASIIKEGRHWVGITPNGEQIELPSYEGDSVLDGIDFFAVSSVGRNSIHRLQAEEVSAWEAFGGIIEALEGYVKRSEELGLQVML